MELDENRATSLDGGISNLLCTDLDHFFANLPSDLMTDFKYIRDLSKLKLKLQQDEVKVAISM